MTAYVFMHDMGWAWLMLMVVVWVVLWALLIHAWSSLRDNRRESPAKRDARITDQAAGRRPRKG